MAQFQEPMNFLLPPGRLIFGSTTVKNTTDHQNRPLPENKHNFYIGVAVRKDAPGINELLGRIFNHALAGYHQHPGVVAMIQRGLGGGFAFKIKDGDQPNAQGQKSEHAAGCWVFHMSTTFPIKACNAQNVEIDPKMIERGYYVDVSANCAGNGSTDNTAGIYMNPSIVRLLGFGEIIHGGITPAQAFGAAFTGQLPPGASAAPVAPAGGLPGMGGAPVGTAAPAGFTPSPAGFPAQTAAPVQHAPVQGFAPNAVPSNGGMPAGFPTAAGGFPQAQNAPSPTGFPTNAAPVAAAGFPGVQPHTGFVPG